jgi:hypothetical protein
MAKKNYQIKIVLTDVEPSVWRRLMLDPDITLRDFHKIIQTAMGWTNSHLHQFEVGRDFYAPKEFEVEGANNSNTKKLSSILNKEGVHIKYEYDFGDGWMHDITLEKIGQENKLIEIPCCMDGHGKCPPEDCGGTHGYRNLKKVIADPEHEEFEDTMEWLGGEFDPNYFDMQEVNDMLRSPDYGCIWLE